MSKDTVIAWVKGLLAAGISGGASAVTAMVVDPSTFNPAEGLQKLLTFAAVQAAVGVALYLKTSPIPGATPPQV